MEKEMGISERGSQHCGLMKVCLPHRMEIRWDTDINAYSLAQKLSKNLKQ